MPWKVEVLTSGSWSSNALRFATQDEAVASGRALLARWLVPEASRATESTDPVNYRFEDGSDVREEVETDA